MYLPSKKTRESLYCVNVILVLASIYTRFHRRKKERLGQHRVNQEEEGKVIFCQY